MRLFRNSIVAVAVLALGVGFTSCAKDDEDPEEVVQPDIFDDPMPPPVDDFGLGIMSFTPETVYFAFDDFTLNMESQEKLNSLADYMRDNSSVVVQIEGHCDERGSNEYNMALGQRRAEAVKNYLVTLGISPARLSTISYGEEKPAVQGSNEAAWRLNRRSEFVISEQ